MFDNLHFLAPPIVACVLFAGILSYFGNHILSRGIIFIDIAIAQIAALGTMIGILLGYGEESINVQLISYGFTIIVITAFALIKTKKEILPQEAIIGIFYCIALGIALLLADKIPGGSNFITKTITGNILWVTWDNILYCTILIVIIGIINFLLGKRIKVITFSSNSTKNYSTGNRVIDLVFYITFGIVIVKSVYIQGIFLVFILLIAPAASVSLFTQKWTKRIIWSWIIGATGSIAGIYISYFYNISTGPAIVCILGITVFILAFLSINTQSGNKNLQRL
jgi:zinc/manganese transport system permease protein